MRPLARHVRLSRPSTQSKPTGHTDFHTVLDHVTYGYEDLSPLGFLSGAHDAVDRYVVGLKLVGADEMRLFSFIGDDVFTNDGPLPDWWYWQEIAMDFAGPQERESRLFVTLLSKLIGVSIAPSSLTRE